MSVKTKPAARLKRRRRVRAKVRGTTERPRISVFRSNRGISAQLIDDVTGTTVASILWHDSALAKESGIDRSRKAGELLAERGKKAGAEAAVFDRGGYQYHGHVRAFAEGAREGGLAF